MKGKTIVYLVIADAKTYPVLHTKQGNSLFEKQEKTVIPKQTSRISNLFTERVET